jgi:hypothetical protein
MSKKKNKEKTMTSFKDLSTVLTADEASSAETLEATIASAIEARENNDVEAATLQVATVELLGEPVVIATDDIVVQRGNGAAHASMPGVEGVDEVIENEEIPSNEVLPEEEPNYDSHDMLREFEAEQAEAAYDKYADGYIGTEVVLEVPVEEVPPVESEEELPPADPISEGDVQKIDVATSVAEVREAFAAPVADTLATPTVEGPVDPRLQAVLDQLALIQAELKKAQAGGSGKRIKSGSKPRADYTYELLIRAPKSVKTPQVNQLQNILFEPEFVARHTNNDGKILVSEPALFAQINDGAARGKLLTKQEPVRIFQYYRSAMVNAEILRYF